MQLLQQEHASYGNTDTRRRLHGITRWRDTTASYNPLPPRTALPRPPRHATAHMDSERAAPTRGIPLGV